MKTLWSLLIFICLSGILAYTISITGCINPIGDKTNNPFQARTEREFVVNPHLRAFPGMVVAINLEDMYSPEDTIPDTETIGIDRILMRYEENATHNFSLEPNSTFNVKLLDEFDATVFYLAPDNPSVTVYIPAGDYSLYITSTVNWYSDSLARRQTVFIQPNAVEPGSEGHYGPKELNTIYKSGICTNCDLRKCFMIGLNLYGATLSGSDFTQANLEHVDLSYSNLSYADFNTSTMRYSKLFYVIATGANFRSSNLYGADAGYSTFYQANLSSTTFNNGFLNLSNLQNSNLSNASLFGVDIRGANFCGADKTGINSTGVITDESTQCWP